jgi:hypothetical protein
MGTFLVLPVVAALGLARVDKVYAWIFACVVVGEVYWRGGLPVSTTLSGVPPGAVFIKENPGPVIYLPFGATDDAMVHQTRHGQPIFGGMGEREADMRPEGYSKRLENSFIVMLGGTLNDTETPIAYTRADREAISATYRWVWFDRRYGPPMWRSIGYDVDGKYRRLVAELGEPAREAKGYVIWDLRNPIPAAAPGLGSNAVRTGSELTRLPTGNLEPGKAGPGLGMDQGQGLRFRAAPGGRSEVRAGRAPGAGPRGSGAGGEAGRPDAPAKDGPPEQRR